MWGWCWLHPVQGSGQTSVLWAPSGLSPSSKHLLLPSCLERLRATSSRHVGRFALPQQIHCAQTQRRFGRGCLSQAALQHHSWDLATNSASGSRLLADDCSSDGPGFGCLALVGVLLSRLALLCCPLFLFRVYWLCRLRTLVSLSPVARLLCVLLRLLTEACRFGAPGAESQCLIVCRLLSFHCYWLTAHFLPFALSGSCSRLSYVPRWCASSACGPTLRVGRTREHHRCGLL